MNDVIVEEKSVIENLVYGVRGKQAMLDSELVVTKYHNHIHDNTL